MKRVVCLCLSLVLLIACFAGCGKKGDVTGETEIGFNESGYPITDEKITLTMAGKSVAGYGDWNDLACLQEMEKLTNVSFDINQIDASVYVEKKKLMFASEELPEVLIKCDLTPTELTTYGGQGLLIPLEDLIDKYAPNLKKIMEENPAVKQAMYSPDGHIYGLPQIMDIYTPDFLVINREWLDNLGLSAPTTPEEFYNVLKKFKTEDPNGNGINDEIPLSLSGIKRIRAALFQMFDIVCDNYAWMSFEDEKAIFHPYREEYVEGVKFFKKLYDEGLLDIDTFTQNNQQIAAKCGGEDNIVGVTDYVNVMATEELSEEYQLMLPLISANGTQNMYVDNMIKQGTFAITKECRYPEVAMRWADYFYTEEAGRLFMMGVEGKTYKTNPDGSWEWIVNDGETITDVRRRDTFSMGGNYPGIRPAYFDNQVAANHIEKERIKHRDFFVEHCKTPTPIMFFAEEDQKRFNVLFTDLGSYINETTTKFIVGQESIDTGYKTFIDTAKKMGSDELVDIYQRNFSKK